MVEDYHPPKNVHLMPNTYTQLYIHFIFAVKYRAAVIHPDWEVHLHKYITGVVQKNGHKLLAINSVPDHLHMLVGYNPLQSVSELMRLVKGDSSEFVNKNGFTKDKFRWQEGYGAFSNSTSHMDRVVKYIHNQKEHHRTKTFRDEYIGILREYDVDYNEKYIFFDPE